MLVLTVCIVLCYSVTKALGGYPCKNIKGRLYMNSLPLFQAAAAPQGMLGTLLPILLIFVIFYLFIIRPQNKKQKETKKMIDALKKGDKVITIGGIHGVVSSTKDQSVVVKVDDSAKIEFSRSAISTVVVDKPAQKPVVEKKEKATKAAAKKDPVEIKK